MTTGLVAFVADLHANREAVSAVLDHARAQGATQYVFLGDYVGYGADPAWVVDIVREHVAQGAIAVLGNHDAGVLTGALPTMRLDAKQVVDWTRQQLSSEQLDFLAELPFTAQRDDQLYVHANNFDPAGWAYVMSRSDAARCLHATPCPLVFCGHMHDPMLFHLSSTGKSGDFTPTPDVPIPLSSTRRWLAIPGSAGQPRDGNPAACYAMFDPARHQLTFHRVPYNHEAAAAKVLAAGLPAALADRLRHGR